MSASGVHRRAVHSLPALALNPTSSPQRIRPVINLCDQGSDRSGPCQCQSHTKSNSGNKRTNATAEPSKLPTRSTKKPGGGWQMIGSSLPNKPKDSASGSKSRIAIDPTRTKEAAWNKAIGHSALFPTEGSQRPVPKLIRIAFAKVGGLNDAFGDDLIN